MMNFKVLFIFCCFSLNYVASQSDKLEKIDEKNIKKILSGFKGLWQDFIRTFSGLFDQIRSFFVTNKAEFAQKVNETRIFLALALKNKERFLELAKNGTKEQVNQALGNVKEWFKEVTLFHDKVLGSAEDKMNTLQKDWSKMMRDKWNKGMDKIIDVGKNFRADENINH